MKRILPILFALFFAVSANSQNTFNEGDNVLNLGLGLGSTLYTGAYYSSSIPPLSASYEVGIKDELFDENSSLGVGGYLGYSSSDYRFSGSGSSFSNFILGARGSFHYQFIDQLDTYTGLMVGYRIVSWNNDGFSSAASSGITSAFYVGGRYYFNETFAGMMELGYGIAYLNLGVAIKF